eukprot:TRINITY_DN74379_c0_g1_i1.p1 TRINITY_DN74379_c0_g1~~TRINITY_DN74379_c0_g1_i1.p1  ORF type:complete len:1602 (+),score=225.47 TRINITY_DN74379_c0_g1_i1:55-4860(+)
MCTGTRCMIGLAILRLAATLQMINARQVNLAATNDTQASIFVGVFSLRKSFWRREKVLPMWRHAQNVSGGGVIVKFIVCQHPEEGEKPWIGKRLKEEASLGDLAIVDCHEGEGQGAATKKLLETMRVYIEQFKRDFFMKIEDDTFISWGRYIQFLPSTPTPGLYMGVQVDEAHPCRDKEYLGYEPENTFSGDMLPASMSAGSGYTLSQELVEIIVNTGLGHSRILFNEDKSVGLWIQMLELSGNEVNRVGFPGVDGYWSWDYQHPKKAFSTWGNYEYVVHHGLEALTIECLWLVDIASDGTKAIDGCFKPEIGKAHETLVCPSMKATKTAKPQRAPREIRRFPFPDDAGESNGDLSVFVAVFSQRKNIWRRDKVRRAWKQVREGFGHAFTGRFALCQTPTDDEPQWITQGIEEENRKGDVELLDCVDGDTKGGQTRKLLSMMSKYTQNYRNSYFMKIEDDTFVAWKRYMQLLKTKGNSRAYIGVENDDTMPCRDTKSSLYEPVSTFPEAFFPRTMSGRSGYTLGRDLVESVVKTDLANTRLLFNEDRAVAVWLKNMTDSGQRVDYVNYTGVNSFQAWDYANPLMAFSTWGKYPHISHSGLGADTIECLSGADFADVQERRINDCFKTELGKRYVKPFCASPQTLLHRTDENAVSVFVAVFSRRNATWRRDKIRAMWQNARATSGENVTVMFAICKNKAHWETPWVDKNLQEEVSQNDVALLDCDEGHGRRSLTRKLLAAMKLFVERFRRSYFLKIDDDTFISWKKYVQILKARGSSRIYMGIEMDEGKPCRNETNLWYEPFETFKGDVFPKSMSGGSGYTLGGDLVDIIIKTDLGSSNILLNEDRSVGLWIKMIEDSGKQVDHIGIQGIAGFWAWEWGRPLTAFSSWGKFAHVVFHGLEATTIECLAEFDAASDNTNQISGCFRAEVGKAYEKPVCLLSTGNVNTEKVSEIRSKATISAPIVAHVSGRNLLSESSAGLSMALSESEVSTFVAVSSRRSSGWQRDKVRTMWKHARDISGNQVTTKFMLCSGKGKGEIPWVNDSINTEMTKGDLVMLDCEEGYGGGTRTKKLLASMAYYLNNSRHRYFLKVDDDAFISWKRYMNVLKTKQHPHLYMGVEIGERRPCRNESNIWYEPYETFPGETFPRGMAGGPGYTLGRELVEIIVHSGLGESNILYNEDRSVGQWCKLMESSGIVVNYVPVKGIDGFWAWDWEHPMNAFSTWGKFDHVLFHGLQAETIECLALLDTADDDSKEMGDCFTREQGKVYPKLECATQENTSAETGKHLLDLVAMTNSSLQSPITERLLSTSSASDVSVFVGVFSRRSSFLRREKIRPMWRHAQNISGKHVTVKFLLCSRGHESESTNISFSLGEEMSNGDLLLLDCDEGITQGHLTKKLLAALTEYVYEYRNDYFMKIDDDTFISWSRYVRWLKARGHSRVYMGVEIGEARPIRNERLQFYEPYFTYPNQTFPTGMAGGSGYTLGRDLADIVVKTDLGKSNVLFNEDRAVGVWMKMIEDAGKRVEHVSLPGVAGFWAWDWKHPVEAFSSWKSYPFVVHHDLLAATIECLALVDSKSDDAHEVASCFEPEQGRYYDRLALLGRTVT